MRLRRRLIQATLALALSALLIPPFAWPLRGGARLSSPWAFRRNPLSLSPLAIEFHEGMDLAAPAGSAVHAAAPGIVAEAGWSASEGNYVRIRHLLGFESVYAHLSRSSVKAGSLVLARGLQVIGEVGATGRATGPHLHFELRAGGRSLPPGLLLVPHSARLAILGF